MASDLLDGIDSNQLGEDERTYRREQSIFWLTRAAERGSKVELYLYKYGPILASYLFIFVLCHSNINFTYRKKHR